MGYVRIMQNKMEAHIMGYIGCRGMSGFLQTGLLFVKHGYIGEWTRHYLGVVLRDYVLMVLRSLQTAGGSAFPAALESKVTG